MEKKSFTEVALEVGCDRVWRGDMDDNLDYATWDTDHARHQA